MGRQRRADTRSTTTGLHVKTALCVPFFLLRIGSVDDFVGVSAPLEHVNGSILPELVGSVDAREGGDENDHPFRRRLHLVGLAHLVSGE